ncbi:MAG: hypothetical protein WC606_01790 [Candidatus Absconditabacterales bacterium]
MRIFKSSIVKKILGIIVVMGCSGIFLNGYVGVGEVQAQAGTITVGTIGTSDTSGSSTDTMGLWQIMDMILKLIYLLLWPLLVLAGLALDNTLVYASIFHLDAPLWKFWNMMKNFANFALGFMVLFAIIKNLFMPKDEKGPIDIIKKTLIAGILIQASWFLMAAMVDISTIATYAVGGLPLSVLKDTPIGTQKILSVNSSINLNKFDVLSKKGEGFKIRYSTSYQGKPINISPCRIDQNFVIGRTLGDSGYRNTDKFIGDAKYEGYEVCASMGKLVMWEEDKFMGKINSNTNNNDTIMRKNNDGGYQAMITTLLTITGGWENTSRATGDLVNLAGTDQEGLKKGSDFFAASTSTTIADLIKKSKGFVGPLVTIYSSLLNFTQLTNTNVTSNGETSGIFIIKAGVAIALFFPLLALALVLIMRIGYLWLYIVASPFIVIQSVFKRKLDEKIGKYLDITKIIGVIFAPVVTVAALSISLIFMTALVNGFTSTNSSEALHTALGTQTVPSIGDPEKKYDAISFQGVAQVQFTKLPWGEAADWFSWFMINLFAIGLMRMIVFAAIKANVIGEKIAGGEKGIQKFGENVFRTLPILPIGKGGERVGVGSAAKVIGNIPDRYNQKLDTEGNKQVENWLGEPTRTGASGTTFTTDNTTKIIAGLGAGNKAENVLKEAGLTVPTTGLTTLGTQENITAIYTAMDKMEPEQQENIKTGAIPMFGTDWYKKESSRLAKIKIENITIATTQTQGDIQATINSADNIAILKNYFSDTTVGNTYTRAIGTNTLTIKK